MAGFNIKYNSRWNGWTHIKGYFTSSDPHADDTPDINAVYNNSDSSKYVQLSGESDKYYNSCVYKKGDAIYIWLMAEASGTYASFIDSQGSSAQWSAKATTQHNQNGIYYHINYNPFKIDGFPYYESATIVSGSEVESNLPMFENAADAIAYLTQPYTPPVATHVSGGGGGFYGGYKGVIN